MVQKITKMTAVLGLVMIFSASAAAQNDTGRKTRPGDAANARGPELGLKPASVLDIVKMKSAYILAVDLEKRTVTVSAKKDEKGIELAFPQPNGMEQIKLSKKAQKAKGISKVRLEQLKVGSEVRVQYYPALAQFLELIVDETRS